MRIALVKLSALGDVVHTLPVAAALRAAVPDARITWLVEERESVLLRGHPAVSEVVTVPTRRWRRARGAGGAVDVVRALRGLRARLRAVRFDVAFDLGALVKTGLITAATGAAVRVGFPARHCREPLSALFTNRRLAPPPDARHIVDQQLALLGALGVRATGAAFRLPTTTAAETRMEDFFAATGWKPRDRVVALNPGAARADKRWPAAAFARLAARLASEAGARPLVIWGPGEEDDARAVVGGAAGAGVLAPATDLDELLSLLRRASVVVAGDTGPLHMAAALGTPCVALYGPTRSERNGPYGGGHRALQSPDGTMASLDVDVVFRAAGELLG